VQAFAQDWPRRPGRPRRRATRPVHGDQDDERREPIRLITTVLPRE